MSYQQRKNADEMTKYGYICAEIYDEYIILYNKADNMGCLFPTKYVNEDIILLIGRTKCRIKVLPAV